MPSSSPRASPRRPSSRGRAVRVCLAGRLDADLRAGVLGKLLRWSSGRPGHDGLMHVEQPGAGAGYFWVRRAQALLSRGPRASHGSRSRPGADLGQGIARDPSVLHPRRRHRARLRPCVLADSATERPRGRDLRRDASERDGALADGLPEDRRPLRGPYRLGKFVGRARRGRVGVGPGGRAERVDPTRLLVSYGRHDAPAPPRGRGDAATGLSGAPEPHARAVRERDFTRRRRTLLVQGHAEHSHYKFTNDSFTLLSSFG